MKRTVYISILGVWLRYAIAGREGGSRLMELLLMSLKRISAAILSIVFILGPGQTCPFPDTVLLSVPFNESKFTAVQIPGTRIESDGLLPIYLSPLNYTVEPNKCKQCKYASYETSNLMRHTKGQVHYISDSRDKIESDGTFSQSSQLPNSTQTKVEPHLCILD